MEEKPRKLVWKCKACPWSAPGTGAGSAEGLGHQKIMKPTGELHPIVLFDEVAGEIMMDAQGKEIRSLAKAQKLGLIPGKSGRKPKSELIASSALKGKMLPVSIELDTRLQLLYEWDRIMVPNYEGNLSQWIWDSVLGFHIQNRETFRLDQLFQEER